jgi:DNA-binding IscR family transcriptional regulator
VFLDVRDAAAKILENTTLADLISGTSPRSTKGKRTAKKKEKEKGSVLPIVVGGQRGE